MFIDFLKSIDWGGIAVALFLWILPILATVATRYVLTITKTEIQNLQASKPDLVEHIQAAAKFVIPAVEQLRKNGLIPTPEEAKEKAIELVESYLKAKGFDIDLNPYIDIIEAAIEHEVGNQNPFFPGVNKTNVNN